MASECDYILWYARDKTQIKYRQLYLEKSFEQGTASTYSWVLFPDGSKRGLTKEEKANPSLLTSAARIYKADNLTSQGNPRKDFTFNGRTYTAGWKTTVEGMQKLAEAGRIHEAANSIMYVRFIDDFSCVPLTQLWDDTSTATGSFMEQKLYVVQTASKAVQRCILMSTDPGDLVVDPTCGSGTTAYVAEQWGRRWITIDTSRVPLALARQRLLTATYPWYLLKDETRGPGSGFEYVRRQNKKGEEVGGIVPHVTLGSIANNEPPEEEILVDRPEENLAITRVAGPFCVEATIPTASDLSTEVSGSKDDGSASFPERMLEVLRRSPVIRLPNNKTVALRNIRPPAKTLSLSAEAVVDATANGAKATIADAYQEAKERSGETLPLSQKSVAIVFGPENGPISERLVNEASREAYQKGYSHLFVIGFQIEPSARLLIEKNAEAGSIPATYLSATTDLTMGDLLKNMRSSQIFSACGLPDVKLNRLAASGNGSESRYSVTLLGLDVCDPVTMEVEHYSGNDVPAWFLDTNYNGLCFHVSQAFFPRTSAWENLKKALKGEYSDSVWAHLAGNVSTPFELGKDQQIAVKVIDERGNELMVVKAANEAEKE